MHIAHDKGAVGLAWTQMIFYVHRSHLRISAITDSCGSRTHFNGTLVLMSTLYLTHTGSKDPVDVDTDATGIF